MPQTLPPLIRRMIPLGLTAAFLMLAACQTGLPGGSATPADGVTPNAVTGDAIEVTALDAPGQPPAAIEGAATDPVEPVTDPVTDPAATLTADPATDAGLVPIEDSAAVEAEVAPPPEPKSPEALACEKKGGSWSNAGIGSLRTCVFPTGDGGKRCTRESDCEGLCLARSGTCSPIKPLLGCNEILQDNGVRAVLCIE